jgi:transposase
MNSSLTAIPPHLTVNIPRDLIDVDSDFVPSSRSSSSRRKRVANSRSPARAPPAKKSKANTKQQAARNSKKASKPARAGVRSSPRSAARKKGRKTAKAKSKEIIDSMDSEESEVEKLEEEEEMEEESEEGEQEEEGGDLNKKTFDKVRAMDGDFFCNILLSIKRKPSCQILPYSVTITI